MFTDQAYAIHGISGCCVALIRGSVGKNEYSELLKRKRTPAEYSQVDRYLYSVRADTMTALSRESTLCNLRVPISLIHFFRDGMINASVTSEYGIVVVITNVPTPSNAGGSCRLK